jgi:hypothetical protein
MKTLTTTPAQRLCIEATIAKHRAPAVKAPEPDVTIGDWISAASKVFDGKPATSVSLGDDAHIRPHNLHRCWLQAPTPVNHAR